MTKCMVTSKANSINRRTFLGGVAGMGVAGMSVLKLPALLAAEAAPARKPNWQIGCYTRPFDQFDYPLALDAIAEAGFRYVGIMTSNIAGWVMIKSSTPVEEVRNMHRAARKRGLEVLSIYGEFPVSSSLEENCRGLKQLIDDAAICECPHLMLGGIGDERYQIYYQTVAECCDHAAAKGVNLSIKPHGGRNATGPQCRKAIELVGRKNFGLWYDPGNIFFYSDGQLDPVADAATVDGLVMGMSVKDYRPPKDVLVNIGEGRVDFPKVFDRLKQGGFTGGPLLVECLARGSLADVKAAARKARLFLEQLTGRKS